MKVEEKKLDKKSFAAFAFPWSKEEKRMNAHMMHAQKNSFINAILADELEVYEFSI